MAAITHLHSDRDGTVVACFGMWWPVSSGGGDDYDYGDDGDDGDDDEEKKKRKKRKKMKKAKKKRAKIRKRV